MRVLTKAYRACLLAKRMGIRRFAQEVSYRAIDYYHECRLGVTTAETVPLADLGIDDAEQHDYMAMGYRHIWTALGAIGVEPRQCTFMDFGCGMGRAIVAAATLPYREIIGIEVSERLLSCARQNVDAMRFRKAKRVQLLLGDASRSPIPDGVNVMYFYNPFRRPDAVARIAEHVPCFSVLSAGLPSTCKLIRAAFETAVIDGPSA
jgi:SAM-dependent methyltransferase